jgi:protein-S-isoprenylcysteine O-methyltransferase Ste14
VARNLAKWIVVSTALGTIVLGLSGEWRDPWMRAYVVAVSACTLYAVLSVTPDLARERFRPPTRGADATALIFIRLLGFGHLVIGALDAGRWHLVRPVPTLVRAVALPLMMAAFLFIFRAMRENRFFSAVVRIQADRGHHVIDSGPYAVVRHPGYAGMIAGISASGLALGSWIGFALALGYAALIARRVIFEDRFLRRDLPGYEDYTGRVRYRLIPHVW